MSTGGSYDPRTIEREIYRFWEEGGYFHAEPRPDKQPYVIDIPLPNVTGALHLGHALNNTLQDIFIRHKRMCGYEALWMPGHGRLDIYPLLLHANRRFLGAMFPESLSPPTQNHSQGGKFTRFWASGEWA